MDFIDQIKTIVQRIEKVQDKISNEESTKNSFIMPFIEALGYDIYDPHEVSPQGYFILKRDAICFKLNWHFRCA